MKWWYPTVAECPWAIAVLIRRSEWAADESRELYHFVTDPTWFELYAYWLRIYEESGNPAWLELGQRRWRIEQEHKRILDLVRGS